jgi:hypothetical protein
MELFLFFIDVEGGQPGVLTDVLELVKSIRESCLDEQVVTVLPP